MEFKLDVSCRFLNKSLVGDLQSFGFKVDTQEADNMCYVETSIKPTIKIKTIKDLLNLAKKAGNIKISESDSTISLYER